MQSSLGEKQRRRSSPLTGGLGEGGGGGGGSGVPSGGSGLSGSPGSFGSVATTGGSGAAFCVSSPQPASPSTKPRISGKADCRMKKRNSFVLRLGVATSAPSVQATDHRAVTCRCGRHNAAG